ncbi:hypothetical protein VN97_g10983 [Penicillium thymicola]|uniref:Uncharacterized protein n=1 Tax=Penicillium thymicola TaxID=293382 RepID=A0AAI9T7Y6_PENTH|nr:hypothetical protein VN97_g10983 [Penicillium thymicola]
MYITASQGRANEKGKKKVRTNIGSNLRPTRLKTLEHKTPLKPLTLAAPHVYTIKIGSLKKEKIGSFSLIETCHP